MLGTNFQSNTRVSSSYNQGSYYNKMKDDATKDPLVRLFNPNTFALHDNNFRMEKIEQIVIFYVIFVCVY